MKTKGERVSRMVQCLVRFPWWILATAILLIMSPFIWLLLVFISVFNACGVEGLRYANEAVWPGLLKELWKNF